MMDKPVLKMNAEAWNKFISVNRSGVFYMSKPALERMVERGSGRIVNISSIIGQTGNIGQAQLRRREVRDVRAHDQQWREAAQALAKAEKLYDNALERGCQRRGARLHRH